MIPNVTCLFRKKNIVLLSKISMCTSPFNFIYASECTCIQVVTLTNNYEAKFKTNCNAKKTLEAMKGTKSLT